MVMRLVEHCDHGFEQLVEMDEIDNLLPYQPLHEPEGECLFKGSALRRSYRASKVWRTGEGRITPEVASDRLANLKRTVYATYRFFNPCSNNCRRSRP